MFVLNDSIDLKPDNMIIIKKMSIAKIITGHQDQFKLIILDYKIMKARKRKIKVDESIESKKQKLDENSNYIDLKDLVDVQSENKSNKKKWQKGTLDARQNFREN